MTVFRARPLALGAFLFLSALLFLVLTEEYKILLLLSAGLFVLCAMAATYLFLTKKAAGRAFRGFVLLLFVCLFVFIQCLVFTHGTLLPALEMRGSDFVCTGRVSYVALNDYLILESDAGVKIHVRFTDQTVEENPPRENDRIRAKLRCDETFRDPGNTLRFQGILVSAQLERVKSEGVADPGFFGHLGTLLRSGFAPLKYRNLADTLFLGNTELRSPDLAESLKNTQTQHLLSVSGLHVSLILFSVEKYLNRLRFSLRTQSLLLFFVTLLYMALLNFSPSVSRAGIMMAMTLGARSLRRNNDSFTSLMLSAGILCCTNPFTLFDSSFQLSFLSTLGILRIYLPGSEQIDLSPFFSGKTFFSALGKQGLKSGLHSLLMTFSALIFSLPVLLGFSSQLNLWAFIPNLILIPLFTPALTAVFLYLPFSILFSAAGMNFLLWPASKLCDFFLFLFDKTAAALGSNDLFITMNSPASRETVLSLAVLTTLFLALAPVRKKKLLALSFCLVLPLLIAVNQTFSAIQKAKISVLSTAEQKSVLMQTPHTSILWLPEGCTDPKFLLAALEDENLGTLDALVVSKGNPEECLFYLYPRFSVRTLYAADYTNEDLKAL